VVGVQARQRLQQLPVLVLHQADRTPVAMQRQQQPQQS
jgi:hypothetical protein